MDTRTTILPDRLAKLIGIPVARLRQLCASGYFTKAADGTYPLAEAFTGVLKYYQEASQKLPTFDSIAQCAAATGIPREVLRTAKRGGCKAFTSNRVHLDLLLGWLFGPQSRSSQPKGQTLEQTKQRKLELEIHLMELERQKIEGEVVLKSACDQALKKFYAILMEGLDRSFGQELPALAVGLDEVGIHQLVQQKKSEFMRRAYAALKLEADEAIARAADDPDPPPPVKESPTRHGSRRGPRAAASGCE